MSSPQTRVATRWVEPLLITLLVVGGAVITWSRVPADHRDRVWAEDGNIFLGQALEQQPWTLLFHGYAGYQHFIPRLVMVFLQPVLDLETYPVVVFAVCAVLTGLAAAAVFWLSRDLVPWVPARFTIGMITLLIPLATQETIGNLADLHTYAMWIIPWLMLYRPRRWSTSAGWAVVAFMLVMTEIQAVFFVFLIAFRLRRGDRKAWPVFGAFLIASVGQLATAVVGERNTGAGPVSIPSTVIGWLINTVMPLVTADPVIIRAWVVDSGVLVGVLILLPIVIASVLVLVYGDGSQRLLTIALLLGSAAIYTGSVWANSGPGFMYVEMGFENIATLVVNIRYGVAAGMMLVAILPVAAAVVVRRWGGRVVVRAAAWAACAGVVGVLAFGCTMTVSSRGWVGSWSDAVRTGQSECARTDTGPPITLPVAPDRSIQLDCATVHDVTPDR